MAIRKRGELPADLAKARERFVAWRRTKRPQSRIPARLWNLAVRLAGKHGLNPAASALRLDYYSLKKQVEQAGSNAGSDAAFVEVVAAPQSPDGECIVELENSTGAKLRVTLKGHAPPDLAALARGFWNAD